MKAKLVDGTMVNVGGDPLGFVATEITFDHRDATNLRRMLKDPQRLRAWIMQFENRFPENRHPNIMKD